MRSKKIWVGITSVLTIALFSCGGGSGSSSAQTTSYLAYKASFDLVNPQHPKPPISVYNGSVRDAIAIPKYSYNPSTRKFYNSYVKKYIFIDNNTGNLYSLNGYLNGNIQPKILTKLSSICYIENDYIDSVNGIAYLQVLQAGPDGKCGTSDDESYLINSETGEYVSLQNKTIIDVIDSGLNNPSIAGFFVYTIDRKFEKCDTSLKNCTQLLTDVTFINEVGYNNIDGTYYFCIENNGKSDYYIYSKGSLQDTNTACDVNIWENVYYYLSDNNATYIAVNGTLYKFTYTNMNLSAYNSISNVEWVDEETLNRLLITRIDGNGNYISTIIDKTTGDVIVDNITQIYDYGISFATDNVLFLNTPKGLCYLKDNDNTTTCLSNTYMIGFTLPTSGTAQLLENSLPYNYIILGDLNGNVYTLDQNFAKKFIGTVDNFNATTDYVESYGLGDNALLIQLKYNENYTEVNSTVYFLNSQGIQPIANYTKEKVFPVY